MAIDTTCGGYAVEHYTADGTLMLAYGWLKAEAWANARRQYAGAPGMFRPERMGLRRLSLDEASEVIECLDAAW